MFYVRDKSNFIHEPLVNNEIHYNNLIFKNNSNFKGKILLNKKIDYNNLSYLCVIFIIF